MRVEAEVARLLENLPAARESWERFGLIVTVPTLDDALPLADALAAEHVELMVADPRPLFARLRHAGSVFLGHRTPEAIGDYIGGPNHVLPTGRRARFASGLSVMNFMKRTTFLDATRGFDALSEAAAALADAEGLPAHALRCACAAEAASARVVVELRHAPEQRHGVGGLVAAAPFAPYGVDVHRQPLGIAPFGVAAELDVQHRLLRSPCRR
jgi:histidinol dehydrogenase